MESVKWDRSGRGSHKIGLASAGFCEINSLSDSEGRNLNPALCVNFKYYHKTFQSWFSTTLHVHIDI